MQSMNINYFLLKSKFYLYTLNPLKYQIDLICHYKIEKKFYIPKSWQETEQEHVLVKSIHSWYFIVLLRILKNLSEFFKKIKMPLDLIELSII